MSEDALLHGTFTAIVTPFTKDGAGVDYDSLSDLIEFQINSGVQGLVICGSTGEAATLSDEEFQTVVKHSVDRIKGRVPAVAGIGSNNTARACETARFLNSIELDAVLVVTPAYNKPPQEGLVAHFSAVKKITRFPIIAYNVPGRTGVNLSPESVSTLTQREIIRGLKDASGSIPQLLDTVALVQRRISILSGEDGLIHSLMAAGGQGVISVISNVWPVETVAITQAAREGRWEDSLQAQLRALPLVRAMFCETNPIPVKTAAALAGIIKHPTVRLPLVPAQPATLERIRTLLKKG